MKKTFYEFFAGGGMAHAGLGSGWTCAFANDFDEMKASVYAANWGKKISWFRMSPRYFHPSFRGMPT